MPSNEYREVYFGQYCKTCKYEKLKEEDSPCCECLEESTNLYSHKPIKWVEKEKHKT